MPRIAGIVAALVFGFSVAQAAGDTARLVAFTDVTVVPMDRERLLERQTVLVRGDRIAAIGAADAIRVSAGTVRVDGRHKYLMPGIAGMHAHVPVRIAVLRSRSWFRGKPRTFVLSARSDRACSFRSHRAQFESRRLDGKTRLALNDYLRLSPRRIPRGLAAVRHLITRFKTCSAILVGRDCSPWSAGFRRIVQLESFGHILRANCAHKRSSEWPEIWRPCEEPARMARPSLLLVGGNPPVAAMLTDYLLQNDRYEVEAVAYCDRALAVLRRRRVDVVLVLSLHAPWTIWPSSYSPTWRLDLANAILFLKHVRTLHSPPPVILVSGSLLAEAQEEALANGAFAFIAKPVDLAELDRFVVLALESRKSEQRANSG